MFNLLKFAFGIDADLIKLKIIYLAIYYDTCNQTKVLYCFLEPAAGLEKFLPVLSAPELRSRFCLSDFFEFGHRFSVGFFSPLSLSIRGLRSFLIIFFF